MKIYDRYLSTVSFTTDKLAWSVIGEMMEDDDSGWRKGGSSTERIALRLDSYILYLDDYVLVVQGWYKDEAQLLVLGGEEVEKISMAEFNIDQFLPNQNMKG